MFETFLGQRICSYVGELEHLSWKAWDKDESTIKSSKKDSSKKNIKSIRKRRDAMIFELLR